MVIPFTAFFPAGKADPSLIDRLASKNSLQGLLRAAVGGLQTVMRKGSFDLPPSVLVATANFKREADPMRSFLDERVEVRPVSAGWVARTDFYTAYSLWAAGNGFHAMGANLFYEKFIAAVVDETDQPIRAVKSNGVHGYRGIAIK